MVRVLVVDDNQEERATMVAFLRSWGHMTDEVTDVHEALRVLSSLDFDAIVCGILPENNGGFWLYREVRMDPHYQHILFAFWCLVHKDGLSDAVKKDDKGISLLKEPGNHQKLLDFLQGRLVDGEPARASQS